MFIVMGALCLTLVGASMAVAASNNGSEEVVPAVTVEWGASSGNALLAFYRDDSNSCPDGYIEVRTYNFESGTPVADDTVAFTIVVP